MIEPVVNWIEEWCNLYPADLEFNGHTLKSKPKDCVNKMQKFCKEHTKYTKDVIFAATKLYLQDRENDDWRFTKMSTYFISKLGEPSLLEAYCNKILTWGSRQAFEKTEYNPIDDFI